MNDPYLLHIFSPTKNVSPFDINMAYEARYDAVIPYSNVTLEEVQGLTQDVIYSRAPKSVNKTGIFIGGRDLSLALDMFDAARRAMVPPFLISAFVDPSGAITTAAAIVACIERHAGSLPDRRAYILGVGPVGISCAILLARAGAEVSLVSHLGRESAVEVAAQYNLRFGLNIQGVGSGDDEAVRGWLGQAEILVGASKAGICVMPERLLREARDLLVVADANAVPPAGIAGVELHDAGRPLAATPHGAVAVGPLAVGAVKYKVHRQMLETMFVSSHPVYLAFNYAFKTARAIVAAEIAAEIEDTEEKD
jgi:methylene-tetrahydromethanopterin dehydrogenase